MPGLIDDSLERGAQVFGGLGAAAQQQASNAELNLRIRQGQRAGLGAAIGTAAGYGLARNRASSGHSGNATPGSATSAASGSPFGMIFGTVLNKLGGGALNQNKQYGISSGTPAMDGSAVTTSSNPSAQDTD